MKYGLYLDGHLMMKYTDCIAAHKDAILAQEESGVPHEVKIIKEEEN